MAVLSLAIGVAVVLTACQANEGVSPETGPVLTPRQPASSSTDLTNPITSTIRDGGAGGVTVEATWLGVEEDGGLAFKVALDTHSVDLSTYDVAANLALRDSGGRELEPGDWQDERRDSHHRAGTVRFATSPPSGNGGGMTVLVRNLAGESERALTFAFQP